VPYVADAERLAIDELGYRDDGITHVTAHFGFQDEPNIPRALRLAEGLGLERPIDVADVTYFLSRITIEPTPAPGMARWRKKLFVAISRNSADATEWFVLPRDQTITVGGSIPL
jgi:KUP system potassium uptake protein